MQILEIRLFRIQYNNQRRSGVLKMMINHIQIKSPYKVKILMFSQVSKLININILKIKKDKLASIEFGLKKGKILI